MPQPAVLRSPNFIGPPVSLTKQSKIASRMIEVIAAWSSLEASVSLFFGYLLKNEGEAAHAIYYMVNDREQRTKLFMAVAKKMLSESLQSDFEKFFGKMRESARKRNAIAHGIWIYADDYPDHLCLMDQEDYANRFGQLLLDAKRTDYIVVPGDRDRRIIGLKMERYSEKDLELYLDEIQRLHEIRLTLAVKIHFEIFGIEGFR